MPFPLAGSGVPGTLAATYQRSALWPLHRRTERRESETGPRARARERNDQTLHSSMTVQCFAAFAGV
eukprot:7380549-Prymnesium_polylepis.1